MYDTQEISTLQHLSASDPDLNIWISASAGSGKTKVLVDRFLRLLLNGVDPKRILCITFTKAAAIEMITRITNELSNWATCSTTELETKIEGLISALPSEKILNSARKLFLQYLEDQDKLQIQTIHSFCQSILNQFPLESGLEANANIVDDYQRRLLIEQAKDSLLANHDNKNIAQLLADISDTTFNKLINHAIFLNNFAPDFLESESQKEQYIVKIKQALGIIDDKELDINACIKILKNNKFLLAQAGIELEALQTFDQLQGFFLTKTGEKRISLLPRGVAKNYPEAEDILKTVQSMVYDHIEAIKSRQIASSTEGFINLAFAFNQQFAKIKAANHSIDYDDLITLCLRLMNSTESSTWIKYKLGNQISHILIDESQDMSINQWQIVYACLTDFFSDKTIFVVGDPKQSIYSFQGTSPEIFLAMREVIGNLAKGSGYEVHSLQLSESFRSDQKILHYIDAVFAHIHRTNADYFPTLTSRHTSKLNFDGTGIEIWPLVVDESKQEFENLSPWTVAHQYPSNFIPAKALAEKITLKVQTLLQSPNINASDIMILVRKRDELMDYIISSFKAHGIPINGLDRLHLNDHLAIQDLLAVAKFILLPADDYNLACLMKSPVIGLTEEELFTLCQRGELSLWNNLNLLKASSPSLTEANDLLMSILENHELHTPHNLFTHLLDVLKIRTKFLARFGLYINDVLDQFLNIALDLEQQNMSLTSFVHFFENTDLELKLDLDLQKEEVKIMTVHAAKGLQAKVVILPDTTSLPQNKDSVMFDSESGLILYSGGVENSNQFYKSFVHTAKIKMMQEYYRLLYVALTRASHNLIICSWSNTPTLKPETWYEILKETAVDHGLVIQDAS